MSEGFVNRPPIVETIPFTPDFRLSHSKQDWEKNVYLAGKRPILQVHSG